MTASLLPLILVCCLIADESTTNQARALVDAIDALQQTVENFRCEFEGTIHHKGKASRTKKLGEDGLYDTFSGIFIWRRGGDTHSDSLHRTMPDDKIVHENLVVRMREHQAEQYSRLNNAAFGISVIKNSNQVNSWREGCLGHILLLDKIKRDIADKRWDLWVSEDQIEARRIKVLNFAIRHKDGSRGPLVWRYWLDLQRNGHVIRAESYAQGEEISSRYDIMLASFKTGGREVWMPVHGKYAGYAEFDEKKKATIAKEPTVLETIYVVYGTMEFNANLSHDVFTIKYKPGTPISDHLRQLRYEFGQQKMTPRPTKAAAQEMLFDQVAKAEAQKEELVVVPMSEGFDWGAWSVRGFGAGVLISLVALMIQRRRH